VACIEMVLTST